MGHFDKALESVETTRNCDVSAGLSCCALREANHEGGRSFSLQIHATGGRCALLTAQASSESRVSSLQRHIIQYQKAEDRPCGTARVSRWCLILLVSAWPGSTKCQLGAELANPISRSACLDSRYLSRYW